MISIQAQNLASGIVQTLPYITTALPSVVHSVQQDLLLEYRVLLLLHLWLPNNELFHHENSAESTKYDRWSTLPHKRADWAINFCWTFCLLCPTFGPTSASLGSDLLLSREERRSTVKSPKSPYRLFRLTISSLRKDETYYTIITLVLPYYRLKNEIYYIHS